MLVVAFRGGEARIRAQRLRVTQKQDDQISQSQIQDTFINPLNKGGG